MHNGKTDRDRDISLAGAATSINICCNKHVFVMINVLAFAAKDVEHMFVVTKVLSRQKITLVAAPTSDRDRQTDRQTETDKETEGLVNWHLVDVFLGKACITAYHCSEWVRSLHCCQTWEPVRHPTLLSRQWSMRSTDWALKPNQPVRSDPKLCPQVWKQVGASPEGAGGSKT